MIEGIPAEEDHHAALQNVIRRSNYDSMEFIFGVLSAPDTVTLGHHRPGKPLESVRNIESPEGFAILEGTQCDWWTIEGPEDR